MLTTTALSPRRCWSSTSLDTPPPLLNHFTPADFDTPTAMAASSVASPTETFRQNGRSSSRGNVGLP